MSCYRKDLSQIYHHLTINLVFSNSRTATSPKSVALPPVSFLKFQKREEGRLVHSTRISIKRI